MDREYRFMVSAVIGTDEPLPASARRKLKEEAIATLNVYVDIPGVISQGLKVCNGAMYFTSRRGPLLGEER